MSDGGLILGLHEAESSDHASTCKDVPQAWCWDHLVSVATLTPQDSTMYILQMKKEKDE